MKTIILILGLATLSVGAEEFLKLSAIQNNKQNSHFIPGPVTPAPSTKRSVQSQRINQNRGISGARGSVSFGNNPPRAHISQSVPRPQGETVAGSLISQNFAHRPKTVKPGPQKLAAKKVASSSTFNIQQNKPQNVNSKKSAAPAKEQTAEFRPLEHRDDCRSGFSVRKASRTTLRSPAHIKFQDVITNAGGWDSEKHVFVPFCAGTFYFTFHAVSEKDDDFTLALMKNNKYQVTAFGAKEGYHWGSNSALLFLNPGDEVHLELQGGTLYEHPYDEAYNTFTGFLIQEF